MLAFYVRLYSGYARFGTKNVVILMWDFVRIVKSEIGRSEVKRIYRLSS